MIAFVATSGFVGFRLGRNAALGAGALVDTIVLSPDQSLAQGRAEITHFLSGRLQQPGGDPCADATVRLLESGKSDETDARGKFFFSDVRTGANTLEVFDGAGTLLGRTTLTLRFEEGATPAIEQNNLTLPQDVRMLEVTLTLDAEQQSVSLDEAASCAVTSAGTVVNFSGQALRLSAGSTSVVPGGDIVTDGGYVLLPSKAVAITPWGGRQDLTPTGVAEQPEGDEGAQNEAAVVIHPEEQPGEEEPSSETPNESTPEEQQPGEEEPSSKTPNESTPEEQPGEEEPSSEAPNESTPEEQPGEDEPSSEAPNESSPEEQPGEDEPSSEAPNENTPEEQPGDSDTPGIPGVSFGEDGDVILDNGAQIAPDGTVTVPDEDPVGPSDDVVVIPPEGPAEVLPELPETYEPEPMPEPTAPPAEDAQTDVDGDPIEDGEETEEPTPEPEPTPTPEPVTISWDQQSLVDLFQNRTSGEELGTAKVKDSATGEEREVPVIAPGSSGYYDFNLQNNADYNIRFTLSISEGSFHLPILYSVRDFDTNFVYQGDSKVYTDGSPITTDYITIPPHSERRYRLEWNWQMDDWLAPWWDNQFDTAAAAMEDRTYLVSVGIHAQQVYNATTKK